MYGDFHRTDAVAFFQYAYLRRLCLSAVHNHATPEFLQRVIVRRAIEPCNICLFDVMLRVGQLIRQFPVIRQKQQAGGFVIQPPHRKNTLLHTLHQIQNSRAPELFLCCCHISFRFMQHNIYKLFPLPVNFFSRINNLVLLRVDFRTQLRYRFSVYLHLSCRNQLLRFASGRDARLRQKFLQSFFHLPQLSF